jgi:hypothetical protein
MKGSSECVNKQSRIADNGRSSSLRGLGEWLTTPRRKKVLRNITQCLGNGRILWNGLGNRKQKWDLSNWLQGTDHWRALVKTVMDLRVPQKAENRLAEWPLNSQGLCSM